CLLNVDFVIKLVLFCYGVSILTDYYYLVTTLSNEWLKKKINNVFILKNYAFTSWEQRPYIFQFQHNRPITGGVDSMQQSCTFLPVKNIQDEVEYVCITLFDFTDTAIFQQQLNRVIEALKIEKAEQIQLSKTLEEAQNQLMQSEKMSSIGQLAAGVAHEINNPIGYVYSNLGTLEKYVQDVFGMIDLYEQAEGAITDEATRVRIKEAREKLDMEFLKEDLRALMNESKDGITRVKKIVQNLKNFSHVDAFDEWCLSNLHQGLDSTLNIVNNEIKYKADLIKEYGDIPEVECLSSQLNQVFMNLLVNAAHAIEERGTITIRTGMREKEVWVEVADTGKGIAPEHIKKIFDPFFTTKPIGKGTGLGLSLSYGIVQKHHGRIEVQSEVGKGATFRVWLPVRKPQDKQV
ncbi:MAG: ATP-binding protein, partial [Candidatus Nitrotoga sp.]